MPNGFLIKKCMMDYLSLYADNKRLSISSKFDICCKVYKSGWGVLVHHLETVTGSLSS